MADSRYFVRFKDIVGEIRPGVRMCNFDGQNMTAALISVSPLEPGPGEKPHAHENEQINIYIDGKAHMIIEGEEQVCEAGWMAIVPPNAMHQGIITVPAIQVNFSAPARGTGYLEFMKRTAGVIEEE